MTEPRRLRLPLVALLAPSAAALFSVAVAWTSGHEPDPAPPVSARLPPASSPRATPADPGLGRAMDDASSSITRLAASVRALRADVAELRTTSPPSTHPATASDSLAPTFAPLTYGSSTTASTRNTTRPTTRPTHPAHAISHPRQPPASPPAPPVPTIHVTTGSS